MRNPKIWFSVVVGFLFVALGSFIFLGVVMEKGFLKTKSNPAKKGNHAYTNRLIHEKSPYLLQHAHNPVEWYPWGEEAFEKARKENKPIFLSIGYSTCHWCHVMEEESFSNPEIAHIMNQYFVSIKVDREERPDVDNIYMSAVQAMSGAGGWPLNVFLTPGLKPFFGGTYFPPEDRWGRPGFLTVLSSIANAWKDKREEILRSSEALTKVIGMQAETTAQKDFPLNQELLGKAFSQYLSQFDSRFGGFGQAPKFPGSHSLSFLLRYWKRTKETKALEMVEKTLQEMIKGGMHDHIGGGFHRYSTDSQWRIPHFEKMLYDQAILSKTYLEAFQVTKKNEYTRIAKEILDYVLRDMTHPQGGFYSAEDADSAPDLANPDKKAEGAFYIWTKAEVVSLLGKEVGEIFSYYYGIEEKGNALSDPQGEFQGKNILYIAHNLEETAKHLKKSATDTEKILKEAREKLFKFRANRLRPHLDDKILTDWNGLMISSFALGFRVLQEPRYQEAAEKAANFILKNLSRKDGRLLHRYRDGESAILGTIEDYAFFIHGLFDLYEATFKPIYLRKAKKLTQEMLRLFWDETGGGFFFTAEDAEKLLVRRKEVYDGAIPSGNSIAALDLLRVGRLTMEKGFEEKAQTLMSTFSVDISQAPMAYPQMLTALDFAIGPSKEIVAAGKEEDPETQAMVRVIFSDFLPNLVVALHPEDKEMARQIEKIVPFIKDHLTLKGKPTAYICENYVCQLPTTDLKKMIELLGGQ